MPSSWSHPILTAARTLAFYPDPAGSSRQGVISHWVPPFPGIPIVRALRPCNIRIRFESCRYGEDRQELKQLHHIEVPHEQSIRRWLRVQLQVLQARRTYPTDEVLKQIDESMGSEPTLLHKAEKRRILARLNARLAELQGGE